MIDPEIFKPGVPLVLETRERTKGKFSSFFRGYKNKQYLILDHPMQDGRTLPLAEDDSCIIRFIHEGDIIGFRSHVMALIRTPAPLLFLKFPQSVEKSKLRKSARYPVQIDAVCATKRLNGAIESYPRCHILNISAGGCMVETYEPHEKGTIIYLTALLPEKKQADDIEAEVKRIDRKGDNFLLGLEFVDLLDPGYEEVKGFIHMLEAYRVRA